jgi:carboxylate-amine ligase
MSAATLHVFAGYGVELEYMIVDRQTLAVLPIADELLRRVAGAYVCDVQQGKFGWSNELALHLIEIKNTEPHPTLANLYAGFQNEIRHINRLLQPMGAQLMPSAMHPWMDPRTETRLWPHDNAAIYTAYHRIFDCNTHGWSNLQSMHLNLPFADDDEFARLHAAIRLVLPIIPALAASSPIAAGSGTGFMDFRMEVYRNNAVKIPSSTGKVIPETVTTRAAYQENILTPLYQEIAPFDTEDVLQHEWLNSRGAIPRFDRNAIEIRLIDVQECPQADLAIASMIVHLVHELYAAKQAALSQQQEIGTDALALIMLACTRDADRAVIDDAEYLRLLGFPAQRCTAQELWQYLVEAVPQKQQPWQEPLHTILDQGPLARRILHAVGRTRERSRIEAVYRELCTCLEQGRMFLPTHG